MEAMMEILKMMMQSRIARVSNHSECGVTHICFLQLSKNSFEFLFPADTN